MLINSLKDLIYKIWKFLFFKTFIIRIIFENIIKNKVIIINNIYNLISTINTKNIYQIIDIKI